MDLLGASDGDGSLEIPEEAVCLVFLQEFVEAKQHKNNENVEQKVTMLTVCLAVVRMVLPTSKRRRRQEEELLLGAPDLKAVTNNAAEPPGGFLIPLSEEQQSGNKAGSIEEWDERSSKVRTKWGQECREVSQTSYTFSTF